MPPDATDTKRRLLESATAEFAQFGLAGARVDRISEKAKANKRLIYVHFGTKEQLFDLVVEAALLSLADAVAFTADDLPAYAGALFDLLQERPEVIRLTSWAVLERPAPLPLETEAYRAKLKDISRAQAAGAITDRFTPVDLMTMLLGLVTSSATASPALKSLAPRSTPRRRTEAFRSAITAAVAALVAS